MAKSKAPVEEAPAPAGEYRVLALKYRPQTFKDVIGQRHVVRQLQTEIRDSRVGHAYLFTGPRGVGKTSMARIFAKALNCVEGPTPDPCGTCTHCLGIAHDADLDVVEVDAATYTKKEETIELLEGIDRVSFNARNKIYIIDEVHMFSTHSFNVLLKRLEEPPPGVVFILATTNPEKIPETVISRCRRCEFDRMDTTDIVGRLSEIAERENVSFAAEDKTKVLEAIALASEGGMRDAQVALDQLISLSEDEINLDSARSLLGVVETDLLYSLLEGLTERDTARCLIIVNDLVEKGRDLQRFAKTFSAYLRDATLLKANAPTELLKVSRSEPERLRSLTQPLTMPYLLNIMQQFLDLEERMRGAAPARFVLEFAIMKLTAIHPRFVLDSLDGAELAKAPPPSNDGGSGGGGSGSTVAPPTGKSAPRGGRSRAGGGGGTHAMQSGAARLNTAAAPMLNTAEAVAEPMPDIEYEAAGPEKVTADFGSLCDRFIELTGSINSAFESTLRRADIAAEGEGLRITLHSHDKVLERNFLRPEISQRMREMMSEVFGRSGKIDVLTDSPQFTEETANVIDMSPDGPEEMESEQEEVVVARPMAAANNAPPAEEPALRPAKLPANLQEAMERFPDFRDAVDLVRQHLSADPFLFNGQKIC